VPIFRNRYSILFLILWVCNIAWAQVPDQILSKAKEGDSEAQYLVGESFTSGAGYSQGKAIEWFRKAANQGNIKAQVRLVDSLSSGSGALINLKEAFEWAQKAAAAQDADGIYWLAYCYGSGVGVKRDPQKALEYFRLAANRGNPKHQYDLAQDLLYGDEVLPNPSEAFKWYKMAADQKYPDAMVMVAVCMLGGKVTEKDVEGAIRLFDQADSLGSKVAGSFRPAFEAARKMAQPK